MGLQETHGYEVDGVRPDNGQCIVEILGWNYVDQGSHARHSVGNIERQPSGEGRYEEAVKSGATSFK